MRKSITLLSLLIMSILGLKGQEYPINTIPEDLKKDAVAVLRELSTNAFQSDISSYTYTVRTVTSILNNQGKHFAHFGTSTDRFSDLSKFSGTVRDASGKIIKKIKKGDLTYSSLEFDSFTTGSYDIYYQYSPSSYPFTIEYEYEIKRKKGFLSYPAYYPFRGARISVEKASYNLDVPSNITVRHHANYDCEIKESNANGRKVISIIEEKLPAISNDVWQPESDLVYPSVIFAPSDFCYDSQCGNMDDWKNYGLWVNQLLKGRDLLPADFVAQLQNMVSKANSEREKVQIIYEYLQKNTRYVSIQLGIGGYQPETAANVLKNRFGDCKGLTNLMKAMLKAVNIESNYSVIHLGKEHKELYKDFPSFTQMNHVVLLVPLKNDSIWLECTSNIDPFGFVHSGISGNEALIITDEGGKICNVSTYPESNYKSVTNLEVNIDEEGDASGKINIREAMDIALSASRLKEQDREKQVKYIVGEMQVPKINLGEIDITYNPSQMPVTILSSNFEAMDFANKTGNRLFVRGYPLNKGNFKIFAAKERKLDIEIPKRYTLVDTITYILPQDYEIESLPSNIDLDTQFGIFTRSSKQEGNKVISYQEIKIKSGVYKKEVYDELRKFFSQIDTALSSRLVFRKKQ